MPNANIQNMAQIANRPTCANPTAHDIQHAIRIQNWPIDNRCNRPNRTRNTDRPRKLTIVLMGRAKSLDCVNRTLMWTTLYKQGLPVRNDTTYQKWTAKHNT